MGCLRAELPENVRYKGKYRPPFGQALKQVAERPLNQGISRRGELLVLRFQPKRYLRGKQQVQRSGQYHY